MHEDGRGNGLIQFLMSVILSRGTSKVKGDMDEMSECLMGKHSYCTQDMVNLILVGKAISNPHDGNIDLGGQLFKGINEPCEIGQLSLFEYYENLKVRLANVDWKACEKSKVSYICNLFRVTLYMYVLHG